jgi:TetR/AcrR family transcriptional regulator
MIQATSGTPSPPYRSRRKGALTAERILDAAEALFAERGYEGATLRDVAAAVGIRNPSLYNHFSSKESLYAAVLERGIRPVIELLALEVSRPSGAVSSSIMQAVMDLLIEHPNLPRLVQHETLTGGQHLTPMLREWIAPLFASANEAAAGTGAWRDDQVPLLVLAVYNVVVGYLSAAAMLGTLSGDDLLSRDALERQTEFLLEFVNRLFPESAPNPALRS